MLFYTIVALAVYSGGLLILSLLAVLQLWPGSPHLTESEHPVRILRWRTTLARERHLLLIILFMGLLGASTESVWRLAYHVQEGDLKDGETLAYLVKPWIGCTITVIFYGLLRGGLISGVGGSKEINVYGTAGVAGLVGFSATNVVVKLLQLLP